ncbi:MAG: hypothetical protein UV01_C0012G0028 [Parcubacteria group bacterium GW2011_GWA2_42_14]|nr:MAG: hypothetical protein UV01_C0012G0028 [Parcubacteria group bacterium GW2011_GWA2_42_14]OGZ97819.1 MAG: hypothetical protein A3D41_04795 [Candidatus Sungbacteria bacterium RIFCSPHIGHO2_02_FULL_41_12b]
MNKSKNISIIILHGWGGSSKTDWIPWLKKELEKDGFEVFAPDLPRTLAPRYKEWMSAIEETLKLVSSENKIYFVGHSLGGAAILHFLGNLSRSDLSAKKIGPLISGALLIASPIKLLDVVKLNDFSRREFRWDEIQKYCPNFSLLYSKDDPLVSPKKHAVPIKKYLSQSRVQLQIVNGYEHFIMKKCPVILKSAKELLNNVLMFGK